MRFLERAGLQALLRHLADAGYDLIGPTLRDGAIVLDRIGGVADLPNGVRSNQRPGSYRLEPRDDDRLFGWTHGPDAAKRFLFPPREALATIRREGPLAVEPAPMQARPLAFVGLRACDLQAIAVQDRVFMDLDPSYRDRRTRAFLVGVNCEEPGGTCFCASMGSGPRCTSGFDLALTELEHGFVVEVGTARGADVLAAVPTRDASQAERVEVVAVERRARERMGRELDASDLPALLRRNLEHPRWEEVAERCLACANCTNVCPTCFCHDVVDAVNPAGTEATRTREWASCFSAEHSWTAGMSVRGSRASRYRQWLTHKFGTWVDQYGVSGCVGCGRCITWCPVGIDVTEELAAIRATDGAVVTGS